MVVFLDIPRFKKWSLDFFELNTIILEQYEKKKNKNFFINLKFFLDSPIRIECLIFFNIIFIFENNILIKLA